MIKLSESRIQQLIETRRIIHSSPEPKFEEVKTASLIKEHLSSLGFTYEDKIASTGIVCLIDSGKQGNTLLIRADMDALPIIEENNVQYSSQSKGYMHACGHDAHVAVLLGLASELKEDSSLLSKGRILLVFQPAEEGGNGADRMIETGILQKYKVDAAIAMHVWNHIDVGKIGLVNGTMMASVDTFSIKVIGVSGHGAMPQYTVDPIVVSAHIITALQTIVSRNVDPLDPCVVTIGNIHGGNAFNVIPDKVEMNGTIRTYSKDLFDKIPDLFRRIVQNITESFGAKVEIEYKRVNKPTINDPTMTELVKKAVLNVLGQNSITEENARSMGGEDFSAFLMEVPGCYFLVGSRNESKGFVHPHHSSKFDIDEDSLKIGLSILKEAISMYHS